jgi:hypothetical protein
MFTLIILNFNANLIQILTLKRPESQYLLTVMLKQKVLIKSFSTTTRLQEHKLDNIYRHLHLPMKIINIKI